MRLLTDPAAHQAHDALMQVEAVLERIGHRDCPPGTKVQGWEYSPDELGVYAWRPLCAADADDTTA